MIRLGLTQQMESFLNLCGFISCIHLLNSFVMKLPPRRWPPVLLWYLLVSLSGFSEQLKAAVDVESIKKLR